MFRITKILRTNLFYILQLGHASCRELKNLSTARYTAVLPLPKSVPAGRTWRRASSPVRLVRSTVVPRMVCTRSANCRNEDSCLIFIGSSGKYRPMACRSSVCHALYFFFLPLASCGSRAAAAKAALASSSCVLLNKNHGILNF